MVATWTARQGLSSFDEVALAYQTIKPIRGARANEDLRPISQRRYWWNRIMKVSDTKYLLLDGHWAWSATHDNGLREQTAPIVWERKEDGDYMTVRSHMNEGISVSRYTFLDKWLPRGMSFDWWSESGKHYVVQNKPEGGQLRHYLPKFKATMDWRNSTFEMIEDNKLVFKVDGTGITKVSEAMPMQTRRVDKELDKVFKPKMETMWEWMQIVLPVMGDTLGRTKTEYAEQLTSGRASYWYWTRDIDKMLVREILDNPEHDKYMALAGMVAYQAGCINNEGRFEPKKDSYQKFRDCLRKVGGMYAVEFR